jgi:hydroxymethylbilane synthase
MTPQATIRIGTRGSPLALAQANEVRQRLLDAHDDLAPDAVAIEVVKTTGDKVQDRALAEIGGKGLFTKEIEEGLAEGRLDLAVHSMKDIPTVLPHGLTIPCLLPREDPRDAFISPRAESLDALPAGAVIGSASLRRQAQILNRRPDLRVQVFRGNVATRLRKLEAGEVDATLLALAGLRRLDRLDAVTAVIEVDELLPAVAQGAIGVECRADDDRVLELLAPLNDRDTFVCVSAERALLAALDGSCRTPIAGLATLAPNGGLDLVGRVLPPDGSALFETTRAGPAAEAEALGRDAGDELRLRAGPGVFDALG